MAVLTDQQRAEVTARWIEDTSATREAMPGLLKADIRAAINGVDGWLDANANPFNTAIPPPARNVFTSKQKLDLLNYIVRYRWGIS